MTTHATPSIDRSLLSRIVRSPIGALTLVAEDDALVGLTFEQHKPTPRLRTSRRGTNEVLEQAEAELARYFARRDGRFETRVVFHGTELERAVWVELSRIPMGETRTYGEIADALGRHGAARAIGAAVARNPLSIVVPCHRVIGKSGLLTGFAGGVERKAWLLAHEGARLARAQG